ncbi:GAF domain-containing protein [Rhodocytophaga rosea]|uniref:GAF domain-containing protein n=1 Tax=Rhodocytophaga rosea TaxID=2704465 RepID=A0A6C0GR17_9BACT|nr:GAF domain-containing protein [Rhodocytophaga rosea]QHT70304.1 GAF domain-containing protein [Rhodocytophaga rosea]
MQVTERKNYDSEFCGSIPLHLVNLIQPHGILLVTDKALQTIVQVSENSQQLLGVPADKILNQPLASYIEQSSIDEIIGKASTWQVKERIPLHLSIITPTGNIDSSATLFLKEAYAMIEIEMQPQEERAGNFLELYQEVKYIMSALKEADNSTELGQIAVTEIKRLSGFDRVMLYQFDKDWNGTVIAEAREADMEPYLHLHFPASDVPKQARDLYLNTPYRLIPDRNFAPSRLIPVLNPVTKAFTDLSECTLRSVPPVHVEYLKNMNVTASMSTPVIIHSQLWGLISCHHKTPKFPLYEIRAAFELISNVIATQIMAGEKEMYLRNKSRADRIHARLLEKMYASKNFLEGFFSKSPNLLDLLEADGIAVMYDGELKTSGKTPASDQIKQIISWLQIQRVEKVFATDTLPRLFAGSAEYASKGSGLLVIPISFRKGNFILGFRPEVIQTVEWGGNPNERIQFDPDGSTYHPRNSFATWQETVKHTSASWTADVLETAENLRTSVLERILSE